MLPSLQGCSGRVVKLNRNNNIKILKSALSVKEDLVKRRVLPPSIKMSAKTVAVCWFRNDLRYHDNEVLFKSHNNADYIVPVYCFDPRHFKGTYHFEFPKTAIFRAKFLLEAVTDLRNTLRRHGSDLIVRYGKPEEELSALVAGLPSSNKVVVYQEEITNEEKTVEKCVQENCTAEGARIQSFWGSTLYHKSDIPFSINKVPDTYTNFRKAVEAKSRVRGVMAMPDQLKPIYGELNSGEIPSLEQLGIKEIPVDQRTAFPFEGGESTGIARLQEYLWGSDHVAKYKETRNGLIGESYSTKFSPWLAHGCLSPRFIYSEIKKYERQRVANQSTYWVIFEMIWRDYFKFVCHKYGDRVFYPSGIMGRKTPWKQDLKLFDKWKEGRTGVPFVDANMRELLHTGWMSNRGRQNVASFLIKDLGLDWRLGAEWFESLLLDHDVCSNYGNWNYAAGIGNDPREGRKFNMIKQALEYDKEGDYVRIWVEELKHISGSSVHTPWRLPASQLKGSGVVLDQDYPSPVVIAPEWGRHVQSATGGGSKKGGWSNPGKGPKQRGIDFYFSSSKKVY